jgi:DNA-binding MarR family transcriptional regulator
MASAKKATARKSGGSHASRTSKAQPTGPTPATRVLRRFRVVFNAVKTHFRQIEKSAGIGGAQLWALGVIRSNPNIGVGELARAMDVHQSTASNLVKSLVERELIVMTKDAADRRAVALRLLPAGTKVLRMAPGPFAGVLPGALASLDPKTLARLDADLAKLIAVLEADDRAKGIPLGEL